MNHVRTTLVIAPRERFSFSERALASIYQHTKLPFELIYVTGGAPAPVVEYLRQQQIERRFELIHTEQYLSPNQARNLAIPKIKTQYAVFLDNDALVAPGWLDHLLQCADETEAWIVGPLYLIGEFERAIIHMAGGRLHREQRGEKTVLSDEQYLYDTPIAKANMRLKRRQCEYVEFHCMLVRMEMFEQTGLLDEGLLNLHEERDICMTATHHGQSVYIEPKSIVSYVPPPPCEWWDLPYFMLRWSEDWSVASVRRFNHKWEIDAVQHVSDIDRSYEEGTVVGFASAWRSRVAGLELTDEILSQADNLDHARLMTALLASVDREYFNYGITDREAKRQQCQQVPTPAVMFKWAQLFATDDHQQIDITPLRRNHDREPRLILVDQINAMELKRFGQQAFMTLSTDSEGHQCWFAINRGSWNRRFAEMNLSLDPFTLAGSQTPSGQRIRLQSGRVGRLLPDNVVTEPDFAALLTRGQAY